VYERPLEDVVMPACRVVRGCLSGPRQPRQGRQWASSKAVASETATRSVVG